MLTLFGVTRDKLSAIYQEVEVFLASVHRQYFAHGPCSLIYLPAVGYWTVLLFWS